MLRNPLCLFLLWIATLIFPASASGQATQPVGAAPDPAQERADLSVRGESVTYEHDGVQLEGYMVYPSSMDSKLMRSGSVPSVLIVPEWWGLNDRMKALARRLAAERNCYVFVADMYGKGKVTDDPEQAKAWAGPLYTDRELFRARAAAALSALKKAGGERLNVDRVAAIGYCFGGAAVLELAYSGVPVAGVISIHGGLMEPMEGDAARVKGQVLILHGGADPMVKMSTLMTVTQALSNADVPWTLTVYSGAKHAFTNPRADEAGMDGVGYQERAAEAAWRELNAFLEVVLSPDSPS